MIPGQCKEFAVEYSDGRRWVYYGTYPTATKAYVVARFLDGQGNHTRVINAANSDGHKRVRAEEREAAELEAAAAARPPRMDDTAAAY